MALPSAIRVSCLSVGCKCTLTVPVVGTNVFNVLLSSYGGYTVSGSSTPRTLGIIVNSTSADRDITISDIDDGYEFDGWYTTASNRGYAQYATASEATSLLSSANTITPRYIFEHAHYYSRVPSGTPTDEEKVFICYPKFRKKAGVDAWSNRQISINIGPWDFPLTDVVVHGTTWYWTNKIFDGTLSAPGTSGAYVFDGWYTLQHDASSLADEDPAYATVLMSKSTSMSVSEVQSKAKKTTHGDYFCYAKYVGKELIVTYNPNGGFSDRYFDRVRVAGTFPALPTATFGTETTNRWYTAKTGGTEIHQGDTVTQTDDFTLYARWSVPVNTHTLNFNANGGTVSPATRTLAEGAAYGTLPTPTRSGYTFVEWRTAPYVGTLVTSSTKMGTDDVTIYAIWMGNPFTITLNPNGGTVSPTTKSVQNGSTYGILPRPTRSGFIFDGWWTSATGGTKITATDKPSGSQTVYAHWKQDGGEVVPWVF